ncbi:parB-like partition protein [Caldicellulosiruptor acetigenus I77R1B]|uniref:ParB-like partition protein n=1 Tax=Caldicellulosiruptor acetigenus (strain ATCC 700853 / DSM 12137 / I77R1B) TaxID=632335 RepID=E4S936_CALA7|nr:ParB/RepB/Spo0J family partition protein [Caldicellulosiruptor acetigenus]ADQ42041.1 parB-like partition protein [Caldicellulosiruptor acetigenus I77R1B]WAM36232.1 ParB/RepB/Spo0J family partition protein [Caldicellulosiruptor acetigenus]
MKKRLGRGLDALFGDDVISSEKEKEEVISEEENIERIEEIDIDLIDLSENQPRKIFNEEEIEELANSIKSVGLIQPLVVQKKGDKYVLIAGERRLRACKLAGVQKVKCIVKEYENPLEIALIENIQRKDLNPYEKALAFKRLMDEFGYTQEELAKRLGISRSKVANTLRILNLGKKIIDLIIEGKISEGHAKVLLSVEDEEQRNKLAELVAEKNLSVRELESIIKSSDDKKEFEVESEIIREIEENLMKLFGLKVKIQKKKNKGKIEIEFSSDEELEKIISILMP